MRVRVAALHDPRDIAALAGLRRAWTEEQAGGPVEDDGYAAAFAQWLEHERHQRVCWLAEDVAATVGMLTMLVYTRMPRPVSAAAPARPRQWGYLADVYVLPGHRGHGVGTALLAAATSYADERGFPRLVLSPSDRAVALYERAGFSPATSLMLRPGP